MISKKKIHRKVGRFYQVGKILSSFGNLRGAPAGKGSPHDPAWIMLLLACCPLSLSKASQFGSPLLAGAFEGLCVGSSLCAWVRGASFFGSGVPFELLDGMLSFFSARKRQNRRFGAGREVPRSNPPGDSRDLGFYHV